LAGKNLENVSSIVIGMADEMNVIDRESVAYPIGAFLSDTGGAAGLFLGLNVIGKYFHKLKLIQEGDVKSDWFLTQP
jgi:hypothetical protein